MGLFGSKKKEDKKALLTDFFSQQDIDKIKETLAPKEAAGAYGKYNYLAKALLDTVQDPSQEFTVKDVSGMYGLLFTAGAVTKMEPELESVLKPAIEKMQSFKKK